MEEKRREVALRDALLEGDGACTVSGDALGRCWSHLGGQVRLLRLQRHHQLLRPLPSAKGKKK
jgi:hypothetical protein